MKSLNMNRAEIGANSKTSNLGTRLFAWVTTAILTVLLCFVPVVVSGNRIGSLEWAIWVSSLVITSTLFCAILPTWITRKKSLLRETSLLFIGLSIFELCWNFLDGTDLPAMNELLLGWLVLTVPFFFIYALVGAGVTALAEFCIGRFFSSPNRAKS